MPTYHITSPDGHVFEVNAPEGASEQDALAHVQAQHAAASPVPQTAPEAPAPVKTSQSLGFYQGITKPLDNAAMALEAGLKRIGVPTDAINNAVGLSSSSDVKKSHADYIADMAKRGVAPGGLGRFAGEVVGTAPLAAVSTNPIALGAMSGAALTDSSDPVDIAKDAAIGGIGGKVGDAAIRGISRVVSPVVSPYVKTLLAEGAKLTPGQILGGTFKRVEDAAKSIPLLGDMIGNAQNESIKSINVAAGNRALKPIGQTVPGNIPAGSELTEHVSDELGNAYDNLLPHLSASQDPQFASDLQAAVNGLSPGNPYAARLQKIIDAQVTGKFPQGSRIAGNDLKAVDEELRKSATSLSTDPSADVRDIGEGVGKVRSAFKGLLSRQNPTYADKLKDIDTGYANYVRMRQAGSSVGAKEGVFTPAQLNSAVKTTDKSVGKGNFAKGNALMQDLSTAADQVVSSKVNDSGTPLRLAVGGALAGGAAYLHPASIVATLGALGAYTKPGLRAIQIALTERPQAAKAIADLIRKGDKAGALAAANGLIGLTAAEATP